jgi:hypothetical protein
VFFLYTTTPSVSSSLDLRAVILVFQLFIFSKSGSEPAIFVRIRRSFCVSCRVSPNLSFSLCLACRPDLSLPWSMGSLSIHGRASCSARRFVLHRKPGPFPRSNHGFFVIGFSAGLVRSIGSSVCFFVGVLLRGLWSPAQSIPVIDFSVGPVFGFSFRAGARTTLLRVGSPTDSPLQLQVDRLFDFSPPLSVADGGFSLTFLSSGQCAQ